LTAFLIFVMTTQENISLKTFTTFATEAKARFLSELCSEEEVISFLKQLRPEQKPLLILGGGSNILFTKDFPGTVLKINNRGIGILSEDNDHVVIRAGAGENWDGFVSFTVERGWGGLENLSLIPGNAGTSPVQNIGAYGAELKDVLHSVETVNMETTVKRIFSAEECEFKYRESIFRKELHGKYIILNCTFRLSKNPAVKTGYPSLRGELESMKITHPSIQDIREAVIRIRRRKLPDPALIGNAGSFFKNPSVSAEDLEKLKVNFPGIAFYPQAEGYKVPAAWLIEQCGWKGKRFGDAGVHVNHPLVLVNYGSASGEEIIALANRIRDSVSDRFGIILEEEVNIV
jgi:UDP-N-acetylmuramate dehydrogenase